MVKMSHQKPFYIMLKYGLIYFILNQVNPGARILEGQGTRNTTKNYIYELLLE